MVDAMIDETTANEGNHSDNVVPAGAPSGAPASSPASANAPTKPPVEAPQQDFAHILSEIKLPERRTVGDEQRAPQPTPAQPPTPPAAPPAPKPPVDEKAPAAVHTLQHDLQHVVRDQKISVIRAAALEQEKKRSQYDEAAGAPTAQAPRAHASYGVIFAATLLLILGIAALGGVYFIASQQVARTPVVTTSDSIVFAEQTVGYELTNKTPQTIKNELSGGRASPGTLGSILRVVPIVPTPETPDTPERKATFLEFMAAIGATPPESLVRALGADFFFGFHTVDENAPVMVLTVTSYDHAFAAMLEWEKTMNADLAPIYAPVPRLATGADGIPHERVFDDRIFRNYDVRALSDDGGTIQLYYAFPTRDILIIAESPYTFTELLSRLQAQRAL